MDDSEACRIATRAEQDLNTYQAKQGLGWKSDSTLESGVDEMVDKRFPQPTGVRTDREAGLIGSDRKPIPGDEGGIRDNRRRLAQARGFEGRGEPKDKLD